MQWMMLLLVYYFTLFLILYMMSSAPERFRRSWFWGVTELKWERITMDFITKLPKITGGLHTIWVIIDKLTKSAHFLPIKETDKMEKLTRTCWVLSILTLLSVHATLNTLDLCFLYYTCK